MSLSIVIPAYNEEHEIGKTLTRILSLLSFPSIVEIIVINNGSTDGTQKVINNFASVISVELKSKVTVAAARNVGWRIAKNNIVAFLDADILITEPWQDAIRSFCACHNGQEKIVTGCRVSIAETPSYLEKIWFGAMSPQKQGGYINSGNLITTKQVLEDISGFREELISGEDVDFCVRAQLDGALIYSDKNFFVHHEGYPKTFKDFYLRERWHGAGDFKTWLQFLNSKVAIYSVIFVSLCIASPLIVWLFGWASGLLGFGAALFLNLVFTIYRFGYKNFHLYPVLYLLNGLYSFARVSAVFYRNKI